MSAMWFDSNALETRGPAGLIGIAYKCAFDALEKESILLSKKGFEVF